MATEAAPASDEEKLAAEAAAAAAGGAEAPAPDVEAPPEEGALAPWVAAW